MGNNILNILQLFWYLYALCIMENNILNILQLFWYLYALCIMENNILNILQFVWYLYLKRCQSLINLSRVEYIKHNKNTFSVLYIKTIKA